MRKLEDLRREEILPLIEDAYRNIASHGGLWFRHADEEFGLDEAVRLDTVAWLAVSETRLSRLFQTQGLRQGESITGIFTDWNKEQLVALLTDLAKNWVAQDGAWFQAVEKSHGMDLAKKLNDKSWGKFTVIEASRIMQHLQIPLNGGLTALEQALQFRLAARVVKQEVLHQDKNTLVLRTNDCRVQAARERKNMVAYPCKSGGMVEHSDFAQTIDPRIETRCICCPPDPHPKEYYCAWEFRLK